MSKSTIGTGVSETPCDVCGHAEMNHASYIGWPRSCNQTHCACSGYVSKLQAAQPKNVLDDPLGIEAARRIASGHLKLTQNLIAPQARDSVECPWCFGDTRDCTCNF